MNTKINTKHAERRDLSFHCTGCLKEDLAKIEAAHRAGSLRTTGNWTAGENLDHIAIMCVVGKGQAIAPKAEP